MPSHPPYRRVPVALAAALLAALGPAAAGATAHTVVAGDSFWAIATSNGISPYALAAANGTSISSTILPGQSLYVPAGSGYTSGSSGYSSSASGYSSSGATTSYASSGGGYTSPSTGMTAVSGPDGTAYLAPSAAQQLQALRQQSIQRLGVDVYPAGPLSGYRTYAQQAELYRQYLAGQGPLAAPPGTSEHETGRALDVGTMSGRQAVDELGAPYGWEKLEAPTEWWHVSYVGP